MATYSHREIVSRRIEYTVPALPQWGACLGDMQAAIAAARIAYAEVNPGAVVADDSLRFFPSDDEIIISFTADTLKPATTYSAPAYSASSLSGAIAHALGTEYSPTRPLGEMADAVADRIRESMPLLNIRDDDSAPIRQRCDEMTHNSIGSETFCHLEQGHDGDHDNTDGLEWPRED